VKRKEGLDTTRDLGPVGKTGVRGNLGRGGVGVKQRIPQKCQKGRGRGGGNWLTRY